MCDMRFFWFLVCDWERIQQFSHFFCRSGQVVGRQISSEVQKLQKRFAEQEQTLGALGHAFMGDGQCGQIGWGPIRVCLKD